MQFLERIVLEDMLFPLAATLFMLRLQTRDHFSFRFGISFVFLLMLQLAITTTCWVVVPDDFVLYALQGHSVLLIVEVIAFLYFNWQATLSDCTLAAAMGYALQNISSNINSSILQVESIVLDIGKSVLVFVFVMVLGYFFFAKRMRNITGKPKVSVCLMGVVLIILQCIFLSSNIWSFVLEPYIERLNIFLRFFNIIFCIVVLEMEIEMLSSVEERSENDKLNWLLTQKQNQYENARATAELINVKYHDLKHYMQNLDGQASYGAQMSSELAAEMRRYDTQYHTGNEALDIVLTEKTAQCLQKDITFSCIADGASLDFMRPVDIYAIISNALDNAIEAVETCNPEERIVSMKLCRQGGFVSLHIENYCRQELLWQEGNLISRKEDAVNHGYGTKSIRLIVEKYAGTMKMQMRNQVFSLDILFDNDKEKVA